MKYIALLFLLFLTQCSQTEPFYVQYAYNHIPTGFYKEENWLKSTVISLSKCLNSLVHDNKDTIEYTIMYDDTTLTYMSYNCTWIMLFKLDYLANNCKVELVSDNEGFDFYLFKEITDSYF